MVDSASGIIADGFAKATKLVNYFINVWRSPIQMGSANDGPLSRCKSSTEEKLGKRELVKRVRRLLSTPEECSSKRACAPS